MSDMEMNEEVETEEFADELSDEALDRQKETSSTGRASCLVCVFSVH